MKIRQILALPELQNESRDPLLSERLHMLSVSLFYALHVLGCKDGTEGLRRYLKDSRASFRQAASLLLKTDL